MAPLLRFITAQSLSRPTATRFFWSCLWPDESQKSTPSTAEEAKSDKYDDQVFEGALYRLSMQHDHPDGPWKAMADIVQRHYNTQRHTNNSFRVLDLASGPRGEPGTSIARVLPQSRVHCTDSSAAAVDSIRWANSHGTSTVACPAKGRQQQCTTTSESVPPPTLSLTNLTKSVLDLADLSEYASGTFQVVTCCYGYHSVVDNEENDTNGRLLHALRQAHRVLLPGGILVTATWENSPLRLLSRDVLATVREGGVNVYQQEDDEAFLPPRLTPLDAIALSEPGELEGLLGMAGFDNVVSVSGTYPFDMGTGAEEQLSLGTILIWQELKRHGAFDSVCGVLAAGGWACLAEEAFWTNIGKYTNVDEDSSMLLGGNTFKLTVSTKQQLNDSG